MKKFWINKNTDSIEKSFAAFQKNSFSKYNIPSNQPDDYVVINRNLFQYYYAVSKLVSECFGNGDYEDSYESLTCFNRKHLETGLAFLVGLVVPRLPKKEVKEIVNVVNKELSYLYGGARGNMYLIYEYSVFQIKLTDFFAIVERCLKEKGIFRLKHEFERC